DGCMQKLPKEQELKQLPHRGPLDWTPLLAALKEIDYQGRTEIFMHPVPRGIPILPTIEEVTAEINAARAYLQERLRAIDADSDGRRRDVLRVAGAGLKGGAGGGGSRSHPVCRCRADRSVSKPTALLSD